MSEIRWGIMGTGGIAETMTRTLRETGSTLTAVGSSRPGAAIDFADRWGVPTAVDSHAEVAHLDSVDVVYVATTNDRHFDNVMECSAAGKPALCEKPLAINSAQAREMLETARRRNVFVMEAMWMRFLPFVAKVDDLISEGRIGEIRHVEATFSHLADTDPHRRWMNLEQGGGSLLDLGIYPLSLIHHLVGLPTEFEAVAELGTTGVDVDMRVDSAHGGGVVSTARSTFVDDLPSEAKVIGTSADLRIHSRFHESTMLSIERNGEVVDTYETGFSGEGFRFEVAETERCLLAGLSESPLRPHIDTLAVMEWMDGIRQRTGVVYPVDGR